jgi:hypothetical protein
LNWKIDEYKDKNLAEMIDITKENYGEIEISDEKFLKWQYFNNPAGKALIKLAKSNDNEVVGQYVIIPMKIKVNEEIVDSTLSLNTLTRKDYRGKGIFTGLADAVYNQCKEDKLEFTYGFPNQNSYPGFIKKLQFTDLGTLPLMVYPLNIEKLVLKKFDSKLLAKLGSPFKYIFNIKIENKNDITIKTIDEDFDDFNMFWENVKDKYKVIGVRNSEYIKWRYKDVPIREYSIIGAYRNDELVSYAVLRNTEIEKFNCGMIVDFMVKEGETLAGIKVIKESTIKFNNDGMELVGCLMGEKTEEYEILKKSKFLKCPKFLEPQPFTVVYRNHFNNRNEVIEDITNWFLTMGDYDVI